MSKTYDYIIIGAGIAGCSVAHFLSKYSKSILLIDRNSDLAQGASGAAGAFLSPLLGKDNKFKDLVTQSLKFSTSFYKENIPSEINNCGVVRIPKNDEDRKKFESYKPYMDFPYEKEEDGYYFKIGSQVNSHGICDFLAKDVEKSFNYEVNYIRKKDDKWSVNSDYKARNLILATGADIELIEEDYFKIRAVWGQKIEVYTSSIIEKNYHKECSLSYSKFDKEKNKNRVAIGATHHRLNCKVQMCNLCIQGANINKTSSHSYSIDTLNSDTQKLLKLANDIKELEDVEVCDVKVGARASSVDYFPMVGKLIDSQRTIKEYPHLKNGSFIKDEMLLSVENLFVLNGVGGRGYVLSPYLANILVEHIIKNDSLSKDITTHRLYKRWVKKSN